MNRFECPKGWRRFGGSCYYLSNTTSTFDTANKTCTDHYLNNSRLIQIRHPVEFYYAAHVLGKNDLFALLVQIDRYLFEGKNFAEVSSNNLIGWRSDESSFRRARLKYFNRKRDQTQHKEKTYSDDDKEIDFQSTTISTSTKDYSEEENIDLSIDDIRHVCDSLSWNVFNNDTNVFLLTRYEIADRFICSIVDTEPETKYEHLCQYGR